jgi:glycosyltransferase involved in cell wall biosynthesis
LRTDRAFKGFVPSSNSDPLSGGAVPTVLVIPTLRAQRSASGNLVITAKYLSGLEAFASLWPGKVASALRVSSTPHDGHLDPAEHEPARSPVELLEVAGDLSGMDAHLRAASVVLITDDGETDRVARRCRRLGVPYVLSLEWDWWTRRQIVWQDAPTPLRAAKRLLWSEASNLRRLRSMRAAAGLQCNGTPAFEAFVGLNPRTMLFFDSRVAREMVVAEDALAARLARLRAGAPLRLVFSGRLVGIKGVDQLPRLAAALDRAQVPFTLDICGSGPLEPAVRADLAERGLADRVRLRGTLDFERELMPFVASQADLFVCCHTQGDPSCTYLETMACGVPIVGYGNRALRGMIERSGAGWSSPVFHPERLSHLIAALHRDRADIVERSRAARRFALAHTFDKTFAARVDHLLACSGRRPGPTAPGNRGGA